MTPLRLKATSARPFGVTQITEILNTPDFLTGEMANLSGQAADPFRPRPGGVHHPAARDLATIGDDSRDATADEDDVEHLGARAQSRTPVAGQTQQVRRREHRLHLHVLRVVHATDDGR